MPNVVRQAVCLAIPVIDGTVIQASRGSRRLLGEMRDIYRGESPKLTVVAGVAGDATTTTEDLEFACRLEARRHHVGGPDSNRSWRATRGSRMGRILLPALLGIALLVASDGHWIPALAGAWLLAVRGLIGWRPVKPRRSKDPPVNFDIGVRRINHLGLARLREVISINLEDKLAYLEAYDESVRSGIPEAAALYTKLLQNPNPGSLSPDDGIWLPDASQAREALAAGPAEEPAESLDVESEIIEAEVVADDAPSESPDPVETEDSGEVEPREAP